MRPRPRHPPRHLDFFLSLPSAYPRQTRVFLADNHDFAPVGAVPGSAGAFREGGVEGIRAARGEREGTRRCTCRGGGGLGR
ncbi:hypothetical protein NL676_022674 [Syzygium grande]|nr:hypothetical protein NL676_022674 [Syzygium grande]